MRLDGKIKRAEAIVFTQKKKKKKPSNVVRDFDIFSTKKRIISYQK